MIGGRLDASLHLKNGLQEGVKSRGLGLRLGLDSSNADQQETVAAAKRETGTLCLLVSLGSDLHVVLYLNVWWHCILGANGRMPGSLGAERKSRQLTAPPRETAIREGVISELQNT